MVLGDGDALGDHLLFLCFPIEGVSFTYKADGDDCGGDLGS